MTDTACNQIAVQTIFGEQVRLTAWNITGPHAADRRGSLWLHRQDAGEEPPAGPDDSAFFSGTALDPEAAMRLGLALQFAAQTLLDQEVPA